MKMIKSSLIFFAILLFVSCSNVGEEKIQPKKSTITESVYASGVIKAEGQYAVMPLVSGVLKSIEIEVGQTVDANQVLFKIENEKAALATDNARLTYELSQENSRFIQDKIAEIKSKVEAAKDKLALDESIYKRYKNLKKDNIFSEVEYERVEFAYKNSKSNYEAALKQYEQLKIQLKNEQSKSNINLKINQKTEADFTVKSSLGGKVFDVLVKPGTLVTPQTVLAIIGKDESYFMELEIDENDMVKVAIGQKLIVTLDSYKNQVFEAIVDKIYPIMNERSRTFKIEAHFIENPPKLYPNLTVETNIIVKTKQNAITIPRSYLLENQYVILKNNDKRKVTIGLINNDYVEIVKGLSEDETIIKP